MHNDKETISASEINKFTYCPYQWYYGRVYGSKELRRLKQEKNKEYGYEDSTFSNFNKGNQFHHRYHVLYKLKNVLAGAVYIILAIVIAYFIMMVMKNG